jgi:hypothetical protein
MLMGMHRRRFSQTGKKEEERLLYGHVEMGV